MHNRSGSHAQKSQGRIPLSFFAFPIRHARPHFGEHIFTRSAGRLRQIKKGAVMLKEFKDFAMKGNVVDLAIGIIIAGAFGKIVESMVGDVIMPIIGMIGNFDFSNLYLAPLTKIPADTGYADAKKLGAVIGYGQFVTYVINFLIIAWVLFLLVKAMNRLKMEQAAAAAEAPPAQEVLLTEIRDLLKKK